MREISLRHVLCVIPSIRATVKPHGRRYGRICRGRIFAQSQSTQTTQTYKMHLQNAKCNQTPHREHVQHTNMQRKYKLHKTDMHALNNIILWQIRMKCMEFASNVMKLQKFLTISVISQRFKEIH